MAGKFAFGTQFSVTVNSVKTVVGNLTSINGVEITADEIDTTTHDTADGYRTFEQGLKDAGSVTLEGYYTGADSQVALKTLIDSGDSTACEIAFPATLGAAWTFNGFVTAFATSEPFDDKIGFTASVKVSGKPTLTSGS